MIYKKDVRQSRKQTIPEEIMDRGGYDVKERLLSIPETDNLQGDIQP